MTVPLHVFEERYKRLVRHATAQEPARFVIAPPPGDGLDDEGSARPGEIGTLIDVLDATENPDGTFRLLGHGRERCRLLGVREENVPEPSGGERPLWFATVEPWPLERGDPNDERLAAWDALEAFERYGDRYFSEDAREQAESAMPDDPLYQASFVCANLRLPPPDAQRLLEAPSLVDRFREARRAIDARLDAAEDDDVSDAADPADAADTEDASDPPADPA